MAVPSRGVTHQPWERHLAQALGVANTTSAHHAGVMMLRCMIEVDGYTPEEAWRHFDSLCDFHLPEELMTRARNRVAERYGYHIPRGTYDDTANKTGTADSQVGA